MIFKLLMYVLSHGCLLSSYKAFFNLYTWIRLACVLTSSGCKCLFVVYAFFPWEASCYESCLVSHDDSIYYMLDHVDPYGRHYRLPFKSRHHILDIILLVLFDHCLLPFLLVYFFIAGRLCINDVSQQCHITRVSLRPLYFFESIAILFFILDSLLNCCHLFFGKSLILLFL